SNKMWSSFVKNYNRLHRTGPTVEGAVKIVEAANAVYPISNASTILDVGCGGGHIVSHILETHGHQLPPAARIIASDFVEGMVHLVREDQRNNIAQGKAVWERLETAVLDAMDLSSFGDGECSHVLAGFVYSGIPDSEKALKEAHRVLRKDGAIALTNVKEAEWLDLLQVIKEVKPDLPELPKIKSMSPTWYEDAGTRGHLERAGFREIEVRQIPLKYEYEAYEVVGEKLFDSLPFMERWLGQMSEREIRRARELVVERVRGMYPSEPFALLGKATLAIGRK
ncbi:hypothetical protein AJ79_09883, partial [Helicocarpus griseus UAMH5409]